MHFPGDNTELGYNLQRRQDMNCPCDVWLCGKPRGRKRKRHQYQRDNTELGYNLQRPQDMNCPCDVWLCGKPRGRKRKRHQYQGDNTELGYNSQRRQDMNCPCDVWLCGKPRGRKRKRHQYQTPKIYQPSTFQPCVHRFFKTEPVDRECLSHEQYMDMLATPKRYPWLGETDFDNPELSGEKKKHKKRKISHEEELASQEHGCKNFSFAEEFINDMWDVMSPDVTDRLIDFLVSEFGITVEEAEDFIDCKSSVGKPAPCAKKQFKAIDSLGPKHKWVGKFSEVLANRIEQHICSILMDRKPLIVQKIASKILNDMCGMTGDITSLQYTKNKCEKTVVIIATRMAFWFEDILKDLNKPWKLRPSITKEEESKEKEVPEEKEEREEEDEGGDGEQGEKVKVSQKDEKEEDRPEEREDKKPVSEEKAASPEEREDKRSVLEEKAASPEEKSEAEEKTPIIEGNPSEKETTDEENPIFEGKHPEENSTEETKPMTEGKLSEDKISEEEKPILEDQPPEEETTEGEEPMKEGKPSKEETTEKERPAEEEKPAEEGAAEKDQSTMEEEKIEEPEEVHVEEPQAKEREFKEEQSLDDEPASVKEMDEEELLEEVVPIDEIPSWEQDETLEPQNTSKNLEIRRFKRNLPIKPMMIFSTRLELPTKTLPTFEVRAKTESILQVQTLSAGTVAKQTAQARGLLASPQHKVPASESPLNLKSAEAWVDWATNIANTADEWGKWLESRFTDAEKQLIEKHKHSDWKAWMAQAHTEALKWRVEEERIKEEGERWTRKLNKQNKEQSEKIVKTTDF